MSSQLLVHVISDNDPRDEQDLTSSGTVSATPPSTGAPSPPPDPRWHHHSFDRVYRQAWH